MGVQMSQSDIMKLLDIFYDKSINGIPKISPDIKTFSNDFLSRYRDKETACRMMIESTIMKCTLSGIITGFGGIITLPVALPLNLASVLYFQMRMIAALAYMSDCDLHSPQTKTFIYACLAGVSLNAVAKNAGIRMGVKITQGLLVKLPAKVINKVNQKIGIKIASKIGAKSGASIGKIIPGIGAVIGGIIDYFHAKTIAKRAYKWFLKSDFSDDKKPKDDNIIEIDDYDIN